MRMTGKDRILIAAKKALLQGGRAGLRVDRVAAEAAINKRMIYHYFGDREALIAVALSDYARTLMASSRLSDPLKGLLQVFYPQVQSHKPQTFDQRTNDSKSAAPDVSDFEGVDATLTEQRGSVEAAMRVVVADIFTHGSAEECEYSLTPIGQRQLAQEILSLLLPGVFQRLRKPVYRMKSTSKPG